MTNIISFCSKVMKKNEQCQILLSCCFLFTNPLVKPLWPRPNLTESTKCWKDVPNWPTTASASLYRIWVSFWIFWKATSSLPGRRISLRTKTMPSASSLVQSRRSLENLLIRRKLRCKSNSADRGGNILAKNARKADHIPKVINLLSKKVVFKFLR